MREQLLKYLPAIKILIGELEKMQQWPREKLMDARDREYEIFRELAKMEIRWKLLLGDVIAQDLYLYSRSSENFASYLNKDGLWHDITTLEIRLYPYPSKDSEIYNLLIGHTSSGYFPRISSDFFVIRSLKTWPKIFRQQVLTNVYFKK